MLIASQPKLKSCPRITLWRRAAALALILGGSAAALVSQPRTALGQVFAVPAEDGATDENAPQRAFTLPSQKSEVADDLADFRRHAAKKTWERAFKSLAKVFEANPTGLLARDDGLLVPCQLVVRDAVASLPPEGREAYRLFHDALAKDLLTKAQAAAPGSPAEADHLEKIFQVYFISSHGDTAADRLGDLYFERGEMDRAAECFSSVLKHHPASPLPRARLLVKLAFASARSGRWQDVRETLEQVIARHPTDAVEIAGQQQSAVAAVEQLLATAPAADAAATVASLPALQLPEATEPAWQFRLISTADAATLATLGQNWGARFPVTDMVPPAVQDGTRVIVNLLGYHLAVDLRTGKLLWRTARFHDLVQKLQQNQYIFAEQYGLALSGDKLFSVFRDPAQLGQHGTPFRLARRDPATGSELWNTANLADVQAWNILGTPLILDDRVVVAAIKPEKATELHALALGIDDGKLLWTAQVGTYQADQSQMYYRRTSQPALARHQDKIFLDTHSGALVQIDAKSGAVRWGYHYESEVDQNQFGWWGGDQSAKLTTAAAPFVAGGTLFFKGMRSQRLHAIDLAEAKLAWKRPVNQSAMIIGADAERLYMGGEEITAIDLKTRELKWATRVPVATGWVKPLLRGDRLFQFTSRGVFELDKSDGDVVRSFRGADLDSLGGVILVTADRLLTISNLTLSAYVLPSSVPVAHAERAGVPRADAEHAAVPRADAEHAAVELALKR